ncbi:flagellar biosynthesis protein FlhA [candidate division KSB1 bacterium]|nr:flagellar biosynthesis protein FlhA [candidate division KSB1 bacterium]
MNNPAPKTAAAAPAAPNALKRLFSYSDIGMSIGLVAIIFVMVIPLPPFLLDILLAMSIAISLSILLTALYVEEPLHFSVFPGLLLVVTLFRLALNVASTRLILGDGYAGHIIQAFGSFVVKGNYIVGLVIFLVLVVINLVVITKGSGRISEVAARFTLDAMPGKQMAIDADLNQGMIDEKEARRRREKIGKEADFYGAMDGASKFVRGDAVAGLLITAINILGGFGIGMWQMQLGFVESLQKFTILTVGDGLVAQIPALITSVAAGIIVTRAASSGNLGHEVTRQLLGYPRAIYVASGVLAVFAITPGLPLTPFLILSAACFLLARMAAQQQPAKNAELAAEEAAALAKKKPEKVEDYVLVDPLEIEIGYGLIPLVEGGPGGDLLDRITNLRRQFAVQTGQVIPPVRIRDNTQLSPSSYVIRIRGTEMARGEIRPTMLLALNPGEGAARIEGIPTRDPSFDLPAIWIHRSEKERAQSAGYTVVEPAAVITTHLSELMKREGYRLMSRDAVQELMEAVKKTHKTVVDELVPGQLGIGQIQKVLQNLLREGLPIRDMSTILETLADYAPVTKDPEFLTEAVRVALSTTIAQRYEDEPGRLSALTIDPRIEHMISDGLRTSAKEGSEFALPANVVSRLVDKARDLAARMQNRGFQPIVITAPGIRTFFRRLIEPELPNVIVLSVGELPAHTQVLPMGTIQLEGQSS